MRIKKDIKIEDMGETLSVTFVTDRDEIENAHAIADALQSGSEYELYIKRCSKNKTADANAYAWKLISLISAEIGLTPVEVYQQQIMDMYCYRDVLIKDSDIPEEISDWRKQGIGWLCEIVGPSNQHEGYSWLRKYRGSSSFNRTEMSHFIDNIVYEARELGIQTEPPVKINNLKVGWQETGTE